MQIITGQLAAYYLQGYDNVKGVLRMNKIEIMALIQTLLPLFNKLDKDDMVTIGFLESIVTGAQSMVMQYSDEADSSNSRGEHE